METKREYKFQNSGTIATGALWYPETESAISNTDRTLYFPLRSFTIVNDSSQRITVILDPVAGESSKEFTVTDGQSYMIENKDMISFYQIAIKNEGGLTISANQLKVSVRNY